MELMGCALRVIEEIKEEVARTPKVVPRDSFYRRLLEVFPLRPLETEEECGVASHIVSKLLDLLEKPDSEVLEMKNDIEVYLKGLARIVEVFEKNSYPDVGKDISGRDMLEFLIESNGLQQADLKKELGGQPVVSAILRGERKLNVRQIAALSRRFNISPAVFIDTDPVRTRKVRRRKRKE